MYAVCTARRAAYIIRGCRRPFSTSLGARLASSARPDILNCSSCSLYKFGDPTSEPSKALFRDLDWRIRDASSSSASPEAWAIVGPRGGALVDAALLGRARADPPSSRTWPFIGSSRPVEQVIKKVSFSTRLESNSYLATSGDFKDYTARYYAIRADDEDAVTLRTHLDKHRRANDEDGRTSMSDVELQAVTESLQLDHLLDIPLVALSNGQTRRARIAKALLSKPEVLILEEPFTGLDKASRVLIANLLGSLHASRSPRILLVLRPQDQVPEWVSNIIELSSSLPRMPTYIGARDAWVADHSRPDGATSETTSIKRKHAAADARPVFQLKKGNIGYKDRKVLQNVSWTVRQGDRVALTGANGSGKSTLLSLVLGDHPASYTQDLILFDEPRAKHSTWSLSTKTGHYSPELFAAFPRRHGDAGLSVYEAIGTGFENIFSYRKLSSEQKDRLEQLVRSFDPERKFLTDTLLHKTLFAEADPPMQALTLVLRALVKKPELLILDEPFAGMSSELVKQCRTYLDTQLEEGQTMIFISHYEEEWPESLGMRLHLEGGRATETRI